MDKQNPTNTWNSEFYYPQIYWPSMSFSHPMHFYYPPNLYQNFLPSTPQTNLTPESKKTEALPQIENVQKCEQPRIQQPIVKQEYIPEIKKEFKSCNCVQSRCLKEYCLCYKNGQACGEACKCKDCNNVCPRLNQRPVKKKKVSTACFCQKSKCSKKYCECYAGGRKCGQECACKDCRN